MLKAFSLFAAVALVGLSLVLVLVLVHAFNDYQNSMMIEFRNATDERLCYVWGDGCQEINPNASSYGDFQSCPSIVAVTAPDGEEIYSREFGCDGFDLSDLLVLINKREGEFVVLDNAP
jgi:hypothetical protein